MKNKKNIDQNFYDVAVYGNGLTAKYAALSLYESGFSVIYISKSNKSLNKDYRTSMLTINSVESLKNLGIINKDNKILSPTKQINLISGKNKNFTVLKNSNNDIPLCWLIKNIDLSKQFDFLLSKLKKQERFFQVDDQIQKIDFGESDAQILVTSKQSFFCSLVVAADGNDSKLRKLSKIKTIERTTGKEGLIATVNHKAIYKNVSWQKFSKNSILAFLAMNNSEKEYGLSSLVWTLNKSEANMKMQLSKEEFQNDLKNTFGDFLGKFYLASPRLSWKLKRIDVPKPYNWRCVLVGDSARSIYPLSGQGYNLAIHDIKDLVESLNWAKSLGLDFGSNEVLNKYHNKRQSMVFSMTNITDGIDWMFSSGPKPIRDFSSLGLSILNKINPIKKLIVNKMNEI